MNSQLAQDTGTVDGRPVPALSNLATKIVVILVRHPDLLLLRSGRSTGLL